MRGLSPPSLNEFRSWISSGFWRTHESSCWSRHRYSLHDPGIPIVTYLSRPEPPSVLTNGLNHSTLEYTAVTLWFRR